MIVLLQGEFQQIRKSSPGSALHQATRFDRGGDSKIKHAFITGVSTGIGAGLTDCLLADGWRVYGLSRRVPDQFQACEFSHVPCDLGQLDEIPGCLSELLGDVGALDLVVLNAAVFGTIQHLAVDTIENLTSIMQINVWSNKEILDWLFANLATVNQVVTMSSGAAVHAMAGWGGYSISKAALDMLTRVYAAEHPDTHITSLAPGIIDTAMQKYLCETVDAEKYPTVNQLRNARGTERMPDIPTGARMLCDVFPKLLAGESGRHVDVRNP